MTIARDDKRLRFFPLDEIVTEPPGGSIEHAKECWWAVCPERGLIYWGNAPQYNASEDLARRVISRLYPWAEMRQVPSVFLRPDGTPFLKQPK